MIDAQEILDSLKEQMTDCSKKFEELNNQIDTIIQQYNEKIIKLQEEGNKQLKELQAQREQVRGEYTALYNQYNKFTQPKPEPEPEQKHKKPKAEIQPDKEETPTKTSLTEAEVTAIKNTIKKTTKTNKNIKESDIPEYLKDEYKK